MSTVKLAPAFAERGRSPAVRPPFEASGATLLQLSRLIRVPVRRGRLIVSQCWPSWTFSDWGRQLRL